jgi:hypothetical protein
VHGIRSVYDALRGISGGGAIQDEMHNNGLPDDGQVTEQIDDLMFLLRLMTRGASFRPATANSQLRVLVHTFNYGLKRTP